MYLWPADKPMQVRQLEPDFIMNDEKVHACATGAAYVCNLLDISSMLVYKKLSSFPQVDGGGLLA